VNEHLSSAEAERLLRERGVKPEKRKLLLDAAAAAVILSELLEDRRAKGISVALPG
jgi:putative Holliday junction resolvase